MHLRLRWRALAQVAVVLVIGLSLLLSACSSGETPAPAQPVSNPTPSAPPPAATQQVSEFEVVRTAVEDYVTSSPQWNIAINIGLADLAKPESLAKLPKDNKIVAYCYTGHTGSQATAILNVLGYDVSNLKFGMNSWTKDEDVAPGRFNPANDRMDYAFETTANNPTETYALPDFDNTSSTDKDEILRAAAEAYVTSSPQWNIAAKDLYMLLNDGDDSNDPFILSVRAADQYAKGHIPGAVNIGLTALADPANLAKLPTDKKIVVYCYTGHTGSQATAMLNMLGYDATNLKFGMTSWTQDTDVAPMAFNNDTDAMDYPFVTGTSPN
jgi:rhodanese-related sulfurtransferase